MSNNEQELSKYNFSSFTEQNVRNAFGLKSHSEIKGYLMNWLNRSDTEEITEEEHRQLQRLHRKLTFYIRNWNGRELREKFIIPIVEVVDFDMPDLEITAFAE